MSGKVEPELQDNNGRTLLSWAADRGDSSKVNLLPWLIRLESCTDNLFSKALDRREYSERPFVLFDIK